MVAPRREERIVEGGREREEEEVKVKEVALLELSEFRVSELKYMLGGKCS